jgi:hypothetical protein
VTLHRFLVILTIALVITLSVVVWFFPSDDNFRADNPFWNGTRDTVADNAILPLEAFSELPVPPNGSALILVPYIELTPAELNQLNSFISQGGILVLADDYGCGNQILEYLGLEARFSGQPVLDPLFSLKNKWLPRVFHLAVDPITGNANSLVLNHATCLIDAPTDNTLALSSSFSFLDINDNEIRDEKEPAGPLPIIAHQNLGEGQIILISDPSIFINSMEVIEDNFRFIRSIAGITTDRLLIDQSHLTPSNLHQTKNLLSHIHSFFITPIGTLAIVGLLLMTTLMPIWYRKGEGNEYQTG